MARTKRSKGGVNKSASRTVRRVSATTRGRANGGGGDLLNAVKGLVKALPLNELEKRLAGLEKSVSRLEGEIRKAARRVTGGTDKHRTTRKAAGAKRRTVRRSSAAKRTATRKATAGRKPAAKRTTARKPAAKRTATRKTAAKRATARKPAAKRTTARKPAGKRAVSGRSSAKGAAGGGDGGPLPGPGPVPPR